MLIQHKVFHFFLTLFLVVFICLIWSENACLRILWGPILWEHFQIFTKQFDHNVSQTGCLTFMCFCLCTRVLYVCTHSSESAHPSASGDAPSHSYPWIFRSLRLANWIWHIKTKTVSAQGRREWKCIVRFSVSLIVYVISYRASVETRTELSRDSAVCRSYCIRKERYGPERFMEEKGVEGQTN